MASVALILAAGKGTRMRSERPKVLHELNALPLIAYPLRAAAGAGAARVCVIVGHGSEEVQAAARDHAGESLALEFATQSEQKGTGHAVSCALPVLGDHEGPVWILSGDVPLLRARTLGVLQLAVQAGASMSMLSFRPPDAGAYGRVLRDDEGKVVAIREFKDATEAQRAVRECNAGVYCVPAATLRDMIPRLGSDNAQGEVYLTDLVERCASAGEVACIEVPPIEVAGVNTPEQLAALEFALRMRGPAGDED